MIPPSFRDDPGGRPQTRFCEAPNCGQATREGKTYCSDHVELHPYVRGILDKLETREQEDAKVEEHGYKAVNIEGITARELLQQLTLHGPRTIHRLARELIMDGPTVNSYVKALHEHGLVDLDTTKRGALVVGLHESPAMTRSSIESLDDVEADEDAQDGEAD